MLKVYDPKAVAMVFAGIPISGLAEGTFLSVEQNEDDFSLVVGADGEACRAKSNNRSGRVTFTLLQSSESNALLSAVRLADIGSPNGDGIAPLLIKDNNGFTIVEAQKAWITRSPAAEFAREVTSREWVIETDNLVSFHGGN